MTWVSSRENPKKTRDAYLTDIDVALHDAVEAALVDADDLHAQESGAEHGLGAAETLVADGDDLSLAEEEEGEMKSCLTFCLNVSS